MSPAAVVEPLPPPRDDISHSARCPELPNPPIDYIVQVHDLQVQLLECMLREHAQSQHAQSQTVDRASSRSSSRSRGRRGSQHGMSHPRVRTLVLFPASLEPRVASQDQGHNSARSQDEKSNQPRSQVQTQNRVETRHVQPERPSRAATYPISIKDQIFGNTSELPVSGKMSMKQEQGIDEVLHEEPRHIEDDEIEDPTCFEELPPSSPNPSIKFDDHEPSW